MSKADRLAEMSDRINEIDEILTPLKRAFEACTNEKDQFTATIIEELILGLRDEASDLTREYFLLKDPVPSDAGRCD